jgi:hypothetical protein
MRRDSSGLDRFRILFLLFASLVFSLQFFAEVTHAVDAQLRLRQVAASVDQARMNVIVLSPQAVGTYTLEVSFDPERVQLIAIEGGSGVFESKPVANPQAFSTGKARFSAFQTSSMDEPTGAVHVATLVFKKGARTDGRSQRRMRSRIEVRAVTLADATGRKYHPKAAKRSIRFEHRREAR